MDGVARIEGPANQTRHENDATSAGNTSVCPICPQIQPGLPEVWSGVWRLMISVEDNGFQDKEKLVEWWRCE